MTYEPEYQQLDRFKRHSERESDTEVTLATDKDYTEYLASKLKRFVSSGFSVSDSDIHQQLFSNSERAHTPEDLAMAECPIWR
jgi:hypothetical protein